MDCGSGFGFGILGLRCRIVHRGCTGNAEMARYEKSLNHGGRGGQERKLVRGEPGQDTILEFLRGGAEGRAMVGPRDFPELSLGG